MFFFLFLIYIFINFCRSGRADAHQAMDAITEEVNADVKSWCTGDRDSEMWRRIIRNLMKLKDLRRQVSVMNVKACGIEYASIET